MSGQVELAVPALASVQVPPPENAPLPLAESVTEPVGGLADPVAVSVTVAVHVDGANTATEVGAQTTLVVVVRVVAVIPTDPELEAQPGVPAAPR